MRILIVEDEREIADGICSVLKKAGYSTDVCYNGLDGLDYFLSDIYDLVLLDIMLPKINGVDVLKHAREEGVYTPVIMLTAKSQPADKILALDSGADDYLTKPFDAGELLARIRTRTRVKNTDSASRLTAFDIRIEPDTFKLYGPQNSIRLSRKEFQLMEYLIMNQGRILPREMILSRIWGLEDDIGYNSLDVYISMLRKKLRFVEATAEIVTKKGVGYYLEDGMEKKESGK